MIFSNPISSTSCDLPLNHILVSRENFMLLSQMRKISFSLCLENRNDFRLSQETVDRGEVQKAQATSVHYKMLQQILKLFLTERSSVAWNTTVLDKLCTGLYQQLEDLDTCLVQETGQAEPALGKKDPTLAVKRYFLGIRLYLKEKKYSDCAWEVVRVEIRRCFFFVNNLIRKKLRK
ncbi:PREDICTED: interferon omega-2-like [Hipposideros armiger]|uniref:Interferon omega-2-like n=1 Tax=Hipposideros armiger TaxID=186990 RepID=A0A8B7QNP5_HIPAR|nr:PREDICTED: interferon omega-2-like [Hipposideros armiger]